MRNGRLPYSLELIITSIASPLRDDLRVKASPTCDLIITELVIVVSEIPIVF